MRQSRALRPLIVALALSILSGVAHAGSPAAPGVDHAAWFAPPEGNPIAFGTLRFGPLDSIEIPEDSFAITTTASYFNLWRGSWHIRTIHAELGRDETFLSSDELRLLEWRGPTDHIYFVDLEGWRTDVTAARKFGRVTASLTVPWIRIGSPHWDSIGEQTHEILDLGGARGAFPRGDAILYLRTPSNRVEERENLTRSGLGNAVLSLGLPIESRRLPALRQRLVGAIQLPTALEGSVAGGGGFDAGLAWFGTMLMGRGEALASAGYVHADRSMTLFGFRRADTTHLLVGWRQPLFSRVGGSVTLRIETSPLAGSFDGHAGRPNVTLGLAVTRALTPTSSVTLGFGEDLPRLGLGPDWTFHLMVNAFPRLASARVERTGKTAQGPR